MPWQWVSQAGKLEVDMVHTRSVSYESRDVMFISFDLKFSTLALKPPKLPLASVQINQRPQYL